MSDFDVTEQIEKLTQELRRGTIVLCVLSELRDPQYGYSLMQRLREKGLDVEQNTLYPLLRRLENQKLLKSTWDVNDTRPRRYYEISQEGKAVLLELTKQWKNQVAVMENILFSEIQSNGEEG